jgi:hypothetical protein
MVVLLGGGLYLTQTYEMPEVAQLLGLGNASHSRQAWLRRPAGALDGGDGQSTRWSSGRLISGANSRRSVAQSAQAHDHTGRITRER